MRSGELTGCEFVNVESEFAACSVAIGASAAGARTYTATASQGLLYMAEALFNASGLGLPIVMTVANRAIGAPINIWNDHSDAMALRDCGWIQLYAADNQEAVDMHVQAFRLAEELSLPVMVCMDGFVLTHAFEPLEVPDPGAGRRVPAAVRAAPGARPRRADDDRRDGRTRRRSPRSATSRMPSRSRHSTRSPQLAARLSRSASRAAPAACSRAIACEDAETVVVALGSVLGTVLEVVDELREQGASIGALAIKSFRPFPARERAARRARSWRGAHAVVVLERAFAGSAIGGIVEPPNDVHPIDRMRGPLDTVIARSTSHGDRRAWRARDHPQLAARAARTTPMRAKLGELEFLDLAATSSSASSSPQRATAASGPARREHPARARRSSRAGPV